MIRVFIAIFFMFCTGAAFADPTLTLTLPDNGSYSYWIQSRNGSISVLPANVSHHASIVVRAPLENGDHLILLDASTGQYAEQAVTLGADGKPAPIDFALGDFHSLAAPAPVVTAPLPAENTDPGSSHLMATLVSLALLAALGWLAWKQFTRGGSTPSAAPPAPERDPGMILMSGRHGSANSPNEISHYVSQGRLISSAARKYRWRNLQL